jgi:putative flippase GtrA
MSQRLSPLALVLRYAAFAVIAVVVNLATQRVVLGLPWASEGLALAAAIAAGTLTGLVVKYLLDKRWIFYDRETGVAAQSKQFGLYTAMGLVTTAIFWGTETAFWLIWKTDLMREAGAVLGLSVGYVTKYFLDRRFVFNRAEREALT